MNDRSALLVPRPQRSAAAAAAAAVSSAAGAKSALAVGPATAAAMAGGAWPPHLLELFMRNATLPKAEAQPRTSE
jgi:hypothetical protein